MARVFDTQDRNGDNEFFDDVTEAVDLLSVQGDCDQAVPCLVAYLHKGRVVKQFIVEDGEHLARLADSDNVHDWLATQNGARIGRAYFELFPDMTTAHVAVIDDLT